MSSDHTHVIQSISLFGSASDSRACTPIFRSEGLSKPAQRFDLGVGPERLFCRIKQLKASF
jgi:hypothetical protein